MCTQTSLDHPLPACGSLPLDIDIGLSPDDRLLYTNGFSLIISNKLESHDIMTHSIAYTK